MNENCCYFDCFVEIGPWAPKDPAQPWSVDDLIQDMQHCHIDAALVTSHMAKDMDPLAGNKKTLEICHQYDFLHPCWVALPHHSGDFPAPDDFIKKMEQNRVRALKIFPRNYQFEVNGDTLAPLLSAVERAALLLIVDAGAHADAKQISWQEIAWIAEQFPNCKILLQSVRWESTRQLTPLLSRYKNIYLEFSNYQGNRMLEFWCEKIGHNRLLFGSQAVKKSPGAARAYVDYAEIDSCQRRAIASENLKRLLGLDHIASVQKKPAKDAVLSRALRALPMDDFQVIDSHAHILGEGAKSASHVVMNQGDAAAVVQRNQRIGVDRSCVSSWTAIWGDYESGNLQVHRALLRFPRSIVGYAVLDPAYIRDWRKSCNYYYQELGFTGLKPYYPKWQIPYNDPLLKPWYDYAEQHRLYCLLHPSDRFKEEVRDLASTYPNIAFILAHTGADWPTVRTHVELAREFSNIYLEITQTNVTNGVLEYMAAKITSHRILYGTDTPMRDPYPQFGWVAYSNLSEMAKRHILGENMQSILDRVRL